MAKGLASAMVLGALLGAAAGDPRRRHPVAGFGRAAAATAAGERAAARARLRLPFQVLCAARTALAARHGREPDEILVTNGAADAFWLLAQSLVAVVRSLTKLWSLAGIRAGYLVGAAGLVRERAARRQPWSVNALACAALEHCAAGVETPRRVAAETAAARSFLERRLAGLPFVRRVWPGAADFLLLEVENGAAVVAGLAARGIAVRPASSFPGLGPDHVRVAVRPRADAERLLAALAELG
jgi:histidinol-phosphate/aromatic aminotransferase/cobyric acid decarboxylase-like protein